MVGRIRRLFIWIRSLIKNGGFKWGVLQYGFKYNEFSGLYDLYFMTTGKRVTGLTYEKMEKVLKKELEYQIGLFKKAKRI